MKRSEPPNIFELENLEPRIMLSGDILTGAVVESVVSARPDSLETGTDQPPIEEILYPSSDVSPDTNFQNSSQYDPFQNEELAGIYSGLAEEDPIKSKLASTIRRIETTCNKTITGAGTLHGFLNFPLRSERSGR